MACFDDVLSSVSLGDGRFSYDVPVGWQQGRGSFGGLVLGVLTRAITETLGADLPLRSMMAAIPAPVLAGPSTIVVETVRAGNALTTATARLEQAGEVRALATAMCARARSGDAAVRWQSDKAPATQPWQDLAVTPFVPGITPEFTKHLEYRLVGPMPFSRAGAATTLGWIGTKTPDSNRDAAYIVALADAYWPAALAVFSRPRPTATIAFTIELIEPIDDLDPAAPLLMRANSPVAQDGYAFETRELWGHDGRLVARNHQTFAIIK